MPPFSHRSIIDGAALRRHSNVVLRQGSILLQRGYSSFRLAVSDLAPSGVATGFCTRRRHHFYGPFSIPLFNTDLPITDHRPLLTNSAPLNVTSCYRCSRHCPSDRQPDCLTWSYPSLGVLLQYVASLLTRCCCCCCCCRLFVSWLLCVSRSILHRRQW